ncbi:hypothetical protein L6452_37130 [Arctium lappa]|uniref:Uncharacterized protein n=1 Tax=Arctium lappa TaxID=4217 RepID=A0ACB8Y2M5_ARCLA|nr:hypothetical protein L6452_37130 [Arctium lappa]
MLLEIRLTVSTPSTVCIDSRSIQACIDTFNRLYQFKENLQIDSSFSAVSSIGGNVFSTIFIFFFVLDIDGHNHGHAKQILVLVVKLLHFGFEVSSCLLLYTWLKWPQWLLRIVCCRGLVSFGLLVFEKVKNERNGGTKGIAA